MPPLTDVQLPPIRHPALAAPYRPAHPSPSQNMLGLERMSAIELGYWGARFGVDVPYLIYPLGWGEWEPLLGGATDQSSADVVARDAVPSVVMLIQPAASIPQGAVPFTFTQTSPSDTWMIAHNLGRFPAAIAIWDTSGQLHSAVVEHTDLNTATISFNSALAGTAVVI